MTPAARRSPAAFLLAAGLLCGAAPLQAQTPAPTPTPLPDWNVSISAGGLVTMSADAGTDVTPTAFVDVDAKLPVGKVRDLRSYFRLGITSAPGQSVDLADPSTFRAAEVGMGVAYEVGESAEIRTYLVAEAGFQTRLPGDPEPTDRVLHYYGGGVRLTHSSGSGITVILGRDQVADAVIPPPLPDGTTPSYQGVQAILYGSLAIPGTKGYGLLIGDATVNVYTPSVAGSVKRDVVRIGLAAAWGSSAKPDAPAAARAPEISRAAPASAQQVGPPAPVRI